MFHELPISKIVYSESALPVFPRYAQHQQCALHHASDEIGEPACPVRSRSIHIGQ